MTKIQKQILFACSIFLVLFVVSSQAQAKRIDEIQFPIGELGNCNSRQDCKTYCDDSANIDKCLAFAEKQSLMNEEEINQAKSYARLMKSKIAFPGNAQNPAEARDYCNNPDRIEECMAFAEKNGFVSKAEVELAKKVIPIMKSGQTPGGCKNKEECERFCQAQENFDNCLDFAKKYNLASDKEIAIAKQFRNQGGPGGCKTREDCAAFCNNSANQNNCLDFAEKNDFVKKEELQRIKDGVGTVRAKLADHPDIRKCIADSIGQDVLAKMENGELVPDPELAQLMQACFQKFESVIRAEAQKKLGGEAGLNVRDCIKQEVGEDTLAKIEGGRPPEFDKAGQVRVCYEKIYPKETPPDKRPIKSDALPVETPKTVRPKVSEPVPQKPPQPDPVELQLQKQRSIQEQEEYRRQYEEQLYKKYLDEWQKQQQNSTYPTY